MAMPDSQRIHSRNLNLIKKLITIISPLILIRKKCASHFRRETANENIQFKKTETWISNSYLIRLSVPL